MNGTTWHIAVTVQPSDENTNIAATTQTWFTAVQVDQITDAVREQLRQILKDAAIRVAALAGSIEVGVGINARSDRTHRD